MRRVKSFTLIESIVSSTILLIIFSVSMGIIVKLMSDSTYTDHQLAFLMQQQIHEARLNPGIPEYSTEIDHIMIKRKVMPYESLKDVFIVEVSCTNIVKHVKFREIIYARIK